VRFSIVTPTSNSERFLAQTIESVISQKGDFEIYYVIVDNRSTDRTAEIAARYQSLLKLREADTQSRKVFMEFVSERDDGMYEAINRGFARTSGDVMAWINSDDVYLPGAFAAVSQAFLEHPEVAWLKGVTSYIDENSEIPQPGMCNLYDRRWIEAGIYGPLFAFIQQDSVFWKSSLWGRAGGCDPSLRLCGDYFLWREFARFEPLYSLPCNLSCFRRRSAQLSADMEGYWREAGGKDRIPGLGKQRLLARCLKSTKLPRGLRLGIRRGFLGTPHYCFLPRPALKGGLPGWAAHADVIDDRVTSAVLL
jgi:glycosyltransferase involved in cell wall biosynthesis